jgi:hypothetical protein
VQAVPKPAHVAPEPAQTKALELPISQDECHSLRVTRIVWHRNKPGVRHENRGRNVADKPETTLKHANVRKGNTSKWDNAKGLA